MQDIQYSSQAAIKSGFGPFHEAMGGMLANQRSKALVQWQLHEAGIDVKSFKESGFAERCCMLSDAIFRNYFDENHRKIIFPSLNERCVQDRTQVGSLLRAMGQLSSLGKHPSMVAPSSANSLSEVHDLSVSPPQGFNCNLALNPLTVELNRPSLQVDPAEMIAHWEGVVAQVMECLAAVNMENVQPACLQVLKILRAEVGACDATTRLYASLVFCDTVVKEYLQFGFLSQEMAKDFAVHFVKMLRPDLADLINWRVISNSLNLQTFDGFFRFYNNFADIARREQEERLAASPQTQRVVSPPASPVQAVAQQA